MKIKSKKKYFVTVYMILCFILSNTLYAFASDFGEETIHSEALPIFESIEEWEQSGCVARDFIIVDERSTGASSRYVYRETCTEPYRELGYHPQITTWQIVDGYYLSTNSSTSMNISLSISVTAKLSISVAASKGNAGYFVKAERARGASRVMVAGTVVYDVYDVYVYDTSGALVSTGIQRRFNKEKSVLDYYAVYQ